jgi:hypothetical protein
MNSKLKAGVISSIGLIIVTLLSGIFLLSEDYFDNIVLSLFILNLGYIWFSIWLWILIKYILVNHYKLLKFTDPLVNIIRYKALYGGLCLVTASFFYAVKVIVEIVIVINFLILIKEIFAQKKSELKNIADLRRYAVILVVVSFIMLIFNNIREFNAISVWLNYFLSVIPLLFLFIFFWHEMFSYNNDRSVNNKNSKL